MTAFEYAALLSMLIKPLLQPLFDLSKKMNRTT